jgi:hypothetical protein
MKTAKAGSEKKSAGTLIVEKYRPRLNKLTALEREHLRRHALRIAFGDESEHAPTHRR